MVRLADLPEFEREHFLAKTFESFQTQPWVMGPAIAERRVALGTTITCLTNNEERQDE